MKKILLTTISLLLINFAIGQIDTTERECLTPDIDTTEFQQLPWFDYNQFLENFLDSIGYPAAGSTNRIVGTPVRFWIPLKFWIYRDDNGTGGPTQVQIQKMVDDLNRMYNQTNNTMIGFYMKCEPTYINNTQHLIKTFVGASLLMASNQEVGCINIHVVDELQYAEGMTLKPLSACIVNRKTYVESNNFTLSHEIGHALGLIHTHIFWDWQIKCFKECVSRTRTWPPFNLCFGNRIRSKMVCESTGDALSDTQADPRLFTNYSCDYISGGSDLWGDSYTNPPNGPQEIPDTHNIMSYEALNSCVNHFSRLQIGVMLYNLYILKGSTGLDWQNTRYTFDSYEPDNNAEQARTRNIAIGEIQERNFHQQYEGGAWSQCDVDWVRFVPTCTGELTVSTNAMLNRVNANTRLTLFNSALVQLAQNDDISAIDLFSSLKWNFVAGQEYFIRVENMSQNVTGYYTLEVGNPFNSLVSISGNNNICPSASYSINNLPQGATVTWSVTPTNIATLGCTDCQQTTIDRISNGTITLSATVSVVVCGQPYQTIITKTITVGAPTTTCQEIGNGICTQMNFVCSSQMSGWRYSNLYGNLGGTITGYHLQVNGGGYFNNGLTTQDITTNYFSVYVPSGGNNVTVWAMNACGISQNVPYVVIYATKSYGCGAYYYSVSPNPATSTVTVAANDVNSTAKTAGATTTKANIAQIEVRDKLGAIKRKFKYDGKTGNASFNVADLPNDVYIIRIFDGINWEEQKILVQK